jgi:hypothetical protein
LALAGGGCQTVRALAVCVLTQTQRAAKAPAQLAGVWVSDPKNVRGEVGLLTFMPWGASA